MLVSPLLSKLNSNETIDNEKVPIYYIFYIPILELLRVELQTSYESYALQHKQKYLSLYLALREAIVSGVLRIGERIPSSRALAQNYGLSRGTVNLAYEMLAGEGYVTTGVGRGTFVAYSGTPPKGNGVGVERSLAAGNQMQQPASAPRLSAWGERMLGMAPRAVDARGWAVDFSTAAPDRAAFPAAEWNRAVFAAARSVASGEADADFDVKGCYPLRTAIARHLGRTRGIMTTPINIVIVNGSMQALALIMQLLVNPGDPVVVESPGFSGI
jgi:GntR family transcriptional regulator/MocR family aminotransferase